MIPIRIKICGVTTPAEAVFAAECGAEAVGLNFYSRSPRCLSTERATAIVRELPPATSAVGVFVDHSVESLRDVAQAVGLHGVQTYDLPPESDFAPYRSIPAFRVKSADDLERIQDYIATAIARGYTPSAILIDSYIAGEMGGTGHKAPWDLLAGFDPGLPMILAGGLTPENVADAIRLVRPWGVDVASGVESAPGRKDLGKVRAFVQAVRSVAVEMDGRPNVFSCEKHGPF